MLLPDELLLVIYKHCDYTTRINVNRAMCWDYTVINPYYDYKFATCIHSIGLMQLITGIHMTLIYRDDKLIKFIKTDGYKYKPEPPEPEPPQVPTIKNQRRIQNKERNKRNKLLQLARNLR